MYAFLITGKSEREGMMACIVHALVYSRLFKPISVFEPRIRVLKVETSHLCKHGLKSLRLIELLMALMDLMF